MLVYWNWWDPPGTRNLQREGKGTSETRPRRSPRLSSLTGSLSAALPQCTCPGITSVVQRLLRRACACVSPRGLMQSSRSVGAGPTCCACACLGGAPRWSWFLWRMKDWYFGCHSLCPPMQRPGSVLLPGGVAVGLLTSVWYEAQVISV